MKYRVRIKWESDEIVEAESKDDAVNQVRHSGKKPRAKSYSAQLVNREHAKIFKAIPRWRKWSEMRKNGKKLREIAKSERLSISTISIGITKFQTYELESIAA